MCVLLVEDEAILREVVAEYLQDCGFTVITARDGDEAVSLIEDPSQQFTVLLTDFNMPGHHDGCDVADRMRRMHPHAHIFVVTGRPDLIGPSKQGGHQCTVISKPFNLSEITARLSGL